MPAAKIPWGENPGPPCDDQQNAPAISFVFEDAERPAAAETLLANAVHLVPRQSK